MTDSVTTAQDSGEQGGISFTHSSLTLAEQAAFSAPGTPRVQPGPHVQYGGYLALEYQIAGKGHDWAWEQETVAHGMNSICTLSQGMGKWQWLVAWEMPDGWPGRSGNVLRRLGDVFPASSSPPHSWDGVLDSSPLFPGTKEKPESCVFSALSTDLMTN